MAKKKRKAKRRGVRGLGCGPGPVGGPCTYDRPLAGLRGRSFGRGVSSPLRISLGGGGLRGGLRGLNGTPAEHAQRAEGLLGRAEMIMRHADAPSDCGERLERNLSVLSMASRAEAEAGWVSGGRGRELDRRTQSLVNLAWRNIKTMSCKAGR